MTTEAPEPVYPPSESYEHAQQLGYEGQPPDSALNESYTVAGSVEVPTQYEAPSPAPAEEPPA